MTTQQQLVIDQCKRNYDDLNRTGEHLDYKAFALLLASVLLAFVSGMAIVPVAFMTATIAGALGALAPREHKRVGDGDWDAFFNLYISVEADNAINQVLSNLGNAITVNAASNEDKARLVNLATFMLMFQVLSVLALAFGFGG
jgi:hypothetical protein